MKERSKTLELVQMALFIAVIVIMAFTPFLGYIPLFVTRATIIHVPVIIGSILLGPKKGAVLGFVFGLTSLVNNTVNPTVTSFVFSPFYALGDMHGNLFSLVVCFVPRVLVGVIPYYVHMFVKKFSKGEIGACIAAGICGSLTNTLLVMHFIYFLFGDAYASVSDIAPSLLYGVILGVIGTNGVPEAIVAGVLCTAIVPVLIKLNFKSKSAGASSAA